MKTITIEDKEYEEISQNEYRHLKKYDPNNCNGYTIRLLFKYYKLKPKKDFAQEMLDAVCKSSAELLIKLEEIKLKSQSKQKGNLK